MAQSPDKRPTKLAGFSLTTDGLVVVDAEVVEAEVVVDIISVTGLLLTTAPKRLVLDLVDAT